MDQNQNNNQNFLHKIKNNNIQYPQQNQQQHQQHLPQTFTANHNKHNTFEIQKQRPNSRSRSRSRSRSLDKIFHQNSSIMQNQNNFVKQIQENANIEYQQTNKNELKQNLEQPQFSNNQEKQIIQTSNNTRNQNQICFEPLFVKNNTQNTVYNLNNSSNIQTNNNFIPQQSQNIQNTVAQNLNLNKDYIQNHDQNNQQHKNTLNLKYSQQNFSNQEININKTKNQSQNFGIFEVQNKKTPQQNQENQKQFHQENQNQKNEENLNLNLTSNQKNQNLNINQQENPNYLNQENLNYLNQANIYQNETLENQDQNQEFGQLKDDLFQNFQGSDYNFDNNSLNQGFIFDNQEEKNNLNYDCGCNYNFNFDNNNYNFLNDIEIENNNKSQQNNLKQPKIDSYFQNNQIPNNQQKSNNSNQLTSENQVQQEKNLINNQDIKNPNNNFSQLQKQKNEPIQNSKPDNQENTQQKQKQTDDLPNYISLGNIEVNQQTILNVDKGTKDKIIIDQQYQVQIRPFSREIIDHSSQHHFHSENSMHIESQLDEFGVIIQKPIKKIQKTLEMFINHPQIKNLQLIKINIGKEQKCINYFQYQKIFKIYAKVKKIEPHQSKMVATLKLYILLNLQEIKNLPIDRDLKSFQMESKEFKLLKMFSKVKDEIVTLLNRIHGIKKKVEIKKIQIQQKKKEIIKIDGSDDENDDDEDDEDPNNNVKEMFDPFFEAKKYGQHTNETLQNLLIQQNEFTKTNYKQHQLEGISWLLFREGYFDKDSQLCKLIQEYNQKYQVMHPFWQQYTLQGFQNRSMYVNTTTGQLTLKFPALYEESIIKGGILADEMGLGKTFTMISTILLNPTKTQDDSLGTLVILPVSLLHVWENEVKKHFKDNLFKILKFYGKNTNNQVSNKFTNYDIVLTTYESLTSYYKKNKENLQKSDFFSKEWHRIVLDEGHLINNVKTLKAESILQLKSNIKWIITGTPLQNRVKDLYPLLAFLKIPQWGTWKYYDAHIIKPYQTKQPVIQNLLQNILQPLILRRTKESAGIVMPKRFIETIQVQFDEKEKQLYQALQQQSLKKFEGFLAKGRIPPMQIFTLILRLRQQCNHWLLLKQTLSGDKAKQNQYSNFIESIATFLNQNKPKVPMQRILNYKQQLKQQQQQTLQQQNFLQFTDQFNFQQDNFEIEQLASSNFEQIELLVAEQKDQGMLEVCCICKTTIEDKVFITNCFHVFCKTCLKYNPLDLDDDLPSSQQLQNPVSVQVQKPIQKINGSITTFQNQNQQQQQLNQDEETNSILKKCPKCDFQENFTFQSFENEKPFEFSEDTELMLSAKLKAIIDKICYIKQQYPGDKIIIFSQFIGMIDFIFHYIGQNKILNPLKLNGSMRQSQRNNILKEFQEKQGNILICSLKVGNVGLNLTCANHMLIVDNWWNPFTEVQAMFRIHRIGQQKECHITKFIVQDSIEEQIEKIKNKKIKMVDNTIGDNSLKKDTKQNIEESLENLEGQYVQKLGLNEYKNLLGYNQQH